VTEKEKKSPFEGFLAGKVADKSLMKRNSFDN
jgi:hypothetical protein